MVRLASLLGARAQAEDTAQEAFVRLHQNWDRLADTDAAIGWLRTTMVNLIRSQARRDETAARHNAELERSNNSADDDLSDNTVRSEMQRLVMLAIRDLPQRQREAIVFHHYLGLSETQISISMGCSVGSVRTHIRRGRSALADKLGEVR
jgi:RNA polymerase sigma factor (sigma-70 family)